MTVPETTRRLVLDEQDGLGRITVKAQSYRRYRRWMQRSLRKMVRRWQKQGLMKSEHAWRFR
jgi:histidinol phosphatase-like enzyme